MAHILLVDDEELYSYMLAGRLEREGHSVQRAQSGEEALQILSEPEHTFDIALVDHRLGPGMDGIAVLRHLQANHGGIGSVLFTGLDEPGVGLEAYRAGAFRYLVKPFEPSELLHVIQVLLEWRAGDTERNWLRVLVDVSTQLQHTQTVQAVGDVLTGGAVQLGFDRSRFYRVVDEASGEAMLCAICQAGVNPVRGFESLCRPLSHSKYSIRAYHLREPVFFVERELGDSFLSELEDAATSQSFAGEWASVPLCVGERCNGILNMDNVQHNTALPERKKELLQLFAGNAAAALERALEYERRQQEAQAELLATSIMQQMGNPASPDALDRLLAAIHEHFLGADRDDNFIVALKDRDSGWYRYRMHIESGQRVEPSWCPPTKGGLIEYVMTHNSPLFIPANVAAFREKHAIPQVGPQPALSWMGVPLHIGEEVVGVMVMENDHRSHTFDHAHFSLFQHLAERLSAVIQTAWLYEQERADGEILRRLQEASELISGLDEESLWLTTLTLCTADYGAGFDRAMLFLAEEGGARLRGRMAIGHLTLSDAQADWEEVVRSSANWQSFLAALRAGLLIPTPLDAAVRDYAITLTEESALAETLHANRILKLSRAQAQARLPTDFVERFGLADYCLVPVKAADKMVGVVVLDNIWEKDPNRLGVLNVLDNLTNQAALLAENLRTSKAMQDLIAVQHEVLVQASVSPLDETLQRIAEATQRIAGADLVAIYPLQGEGDDLRHDHRHTARVGRRNTLALQMDAYLTGLSKHVIGDAKKPVLIGDVHKDGTLYCGERRIDKPIVQNEGICATIVAPVFGLRTGAPRAIFYLDYRTVRQFGSHDHQIVEAFVHLIATAISNWRDAQGLRDTQEARDRELSRLSEVLESSLAAKSDERHIAQLLLEKLPVLFAPLPVTVGIALKVWQRNAADAEPTEMFRYLYPGADGYVERLIPADGKTGITGRAVRTGRLQNVPDVNQDQDYVSRDGVFTNTHSELDLPILVDGQVVAALNIESSQLAAFTAHHEGMAQRLADIAALAIGNVRRQRNLRTVLAATSALTGPTDLRKTLDTIAAEIRQAIPNLSLMVIWYLDPETRRRRLGSYFGVSKAAMQRETPRKEGAVQMGLSRPDPYYQSDVEMDPLFQGRSFVKDEGIASTAIFPLRVENKAVGVMFFSYRTRHEFTDEEKHLYPILAEVAAFSINDALQLHQTKRERERLRATQRVTEVISASVNAEQVIEGVRQTLRKLYSGCIVYLARYNRRTGRLDLPPESGEHRIYADGDSDCFLCQLATKSVRTGKKEVKIKHHTKRAKTSSPLKPTTRVSLGATLVVGGDKRNRHLLGALVLESPQEDAFDRDDKEIIRNVARQTRIALERFEQEASERFQSNVIIRTFGATPIIHDINQYTGRILRRIERLQREPALTDSGHQALNELLEQTQEMSSRIAAMDLRREEQKPVALGVELPRWIKETLRERSVLIRPRLDLSPDITVQAYPKALRRAFYDLTRNAMEAMGLEAENQQLSVSARFAPDPGQVEIRIHNNGPVIPLDVQSKLFSDVYSSKGEERGIGLLLVRAAVERMGGEVWLESSTEEDGTTFVVRLKLAMTQN